MNQVIKIVYSAENDNELELRAMPVELEPVGYMLRGAVSFISDYLELHKDELMCGEVTFDFSEVFVSKEEAFEIISLTKRYEISPKFVANSATSWRNINSTAQVLSGFSNYKAETDLDYKHFLDRMFSLAENNLLSDSANFVITNMIKNVKQPLVGKTVFINDLYNFIFRSYYGMPKLTNAAGEPTGVIKALVNYVKKLERDEHPDFIIFASEGEDNIRKKMFELYKATRETPPEDLLSQIPIVIEMIKKMGFPLIAIHGFEADDTMIAYAREFRDLGAKVVVTSSDKDIMQVIDENIIIYDQMNMKFKGKEECFEKFGVEPYLVPDALALIGDTSDNIPGVKGIGPKSAAKLLNEYGSIAGIYSNIDEMKQSKQKENLINNKDNAFLSLSLARVHDYIVKDMILEELVYPDFNPFNFVKKELSRFEINI